METPLLGEPENTRQAQKFLLVVALFAFPLAASQITIYDVLFDVVCRNRNVGSDSCMSDPGVAREIGSSLSSVSLMSGIVATIVSVLLSAYTDKAGRKFGLMWFMVITAIGVGTFPLLAYALPSSFTPWRMSVPYFLIALGGSPSIMSNLSVLYITDTLSNPRKKTEYLSFLIGMGMSVQAIAPGIGGALVNSGMDMAVYMCSCAVFMGLSALIFCFVIESDSREITGTEESVLNFKTACNLISFRTCDTPVKRRNARIVFLNFIMSNMFAVGFVDLIMVYAKHNFKWTGSEIGANLFRLFSIRTFWAVSGFPIVYTQLTKIWPAQADTVDRSDLVHMYLCNILTILGYLFSGTARSSNQYSRGLVISANDGLAGPIWINSLLKHVQVSHKGEFMAALNFVVKPAEAFGPASMMRILTATVDTHPETVFFIIAALTFSLLVSQTFLRPQFG